MKNTDLLKILASDIAKYGERDISVDILTCNKSNLFKITGVYSGNANLTVDVEVNDVEEFKNSIK